MSLALTLLSAALLITGVALFVVGTVGISRLPDALSRFHALAKIDNLALGFICTGLMFQADGLSTIAMLIVIWLAALISGAVAAQVIASQK